MSTLKANTISNTAGSKSVPTDTVVDGSAKAWVNFNGTGTVAINASFNVSSITDNGTGDYTVNFTNALADANYSDALHGTGEGSYSTHTTREYSGYRTTTGCRFQCLGLSVGSSNVVDQPYCRFAVFR